MQSSSIALSNLRAFVILIVVAFHSVLAYLGSAPIAAAPFDNPPYHWIATPILDVWGTLPARDFPNYTAGSWGPSAADALLEHDGRRWFVPDR